MASPAKKRREGEDEFVVGFVHSLSPTKISKKSTWYFDAMLQTDREEYHRVVVFSTHKRQAFEQAALAKTPVKLTNVKRTLSLDDPEGFDVLCGAATEVQVVPSVAFFHRGPPAVGPLTMANVLALGSHQHVPAVRIKVLPGGGVSRVVSVSGVSRELQELRICDRSGQTTLTLWEDKIAMVNISKSYEITKLTTRRSKDKTTLSSTLSTTITEIPEVGEPESLETCDDSTDMVTISGCVTAIKIIARHECKRCHAVQKNFKERCFSHCCERCEMLQRAANYKVMYGGSLAVLADGEEHTMQLTNAVVCKFLTEHLSGAVGGHAEMQEQLVRSESVTVQVDSEQVVTALSIVEEGVGGSQQEQGSATVTSEAGASREVDDSMFLVEFEEL